VLNYNDISEKNGYFTCSNCVFHDNSAGQGGAVWSSSGNNKCNADDASSYPCASNGLTLVNCQWIGNSISSGSGSEMKARGANIYNYGSSGCWCTYQYGTSDPESYVTNQKQCVCNEAPALAASSNGGVSATRVTVGGCAPNVTATRRISRTTVRPGQSLQIKLALSASAAAKGLTVAISFPQGAVTLVQPTSPPTATAGATTSPLKWPSFDMAPNTKRTFTAKFRVLPSTPPGAVLTFEPALMQAVAGNPPYCLRPILAPAEVNVARKVSAP
jgi:hypothetical protein